MKRFLHIIAIISLLFTGCKEKKDYTILVNPFIGTAGDGNTFPGAAVPFGAVKLSPDTRLTGQAIYGGYHYTDSTILGFSHTHLNGVGEPEYRDILFMPATGRVEFFQGGENSAKKGYRSSFSHNNEKAIPGYYSVILKDYGISAELTATARCGFHKYTFPRSDSSHIIIDLAHPSGAEDLLIRKINKTKIEGLRRSHGWAWDQYVYFAAEFSKPFNSMDIAVNDSIVKDSSDERGKNIKASVNFITVNNEEIFVKVGISAVSTEGAWLNLEKEIPDWNFESVVSDAARAWNMELGKLEIEGGAKEEQIVFYTAMYHALLSPDIFMDVDGKYRGIDHRIHTALGFTNYTVFSLWDTFRALHPLFTIIDQTRTNDFIKSLLQMYDDGGRLPMWPLAGNYTDDMLGYHAVPVIVDAYIKGIRDFDVQKAYSAIRHSSELDKLGLKYYKKVGYLPCDRQGESVSKSLEYCYDDWCISQMAKDLGRNEDYLKYHQRAHNYKNVYDRSTGFMRGRKLDRTWLEPFDPLVNSAYSEGNAYQYMFVPHDVEGLIKLMDGDRNFSQWLDVLFSLNDGRNQKGSIGQYWHGNEPGHHLAYLYNYTGEAAKTQKMVHRILTELYSNSPDGLAGNEDCGQMSAWYIFSSMGFYPVSPGQNIYAIGAPLFSKVTINQENGKKFIVKAINLSSENIYIRSAKLNGKDYTKSYLRHEDILNGSELVFEMGPEPNRMWGSNAGDRPYSENGEEAVGVQYIKTGDLLFLNSTIVSMGCDSEGSVIRYSADGSEPGESSALFTEPVEFKGSTVLKMRSWDKNNKPGVTVEYELKKAALKESSDVTGISHGLHFDYFERFFVSTGDLDIAEPVSSGTVPDFTISQRQREAYFGLRFSGYIRAPEDGIYTFFLKSNDGSRLFIDNEEVIENDGNHAAVDESGRIGLKAGLHKIVVKYIQCGGGKTLNVCWEGPGFIRHEIMAKEVFTER